MCFLLKSRMTCQYEVITMYTQTAKRGHFSHIVLYATQLLILFWLFDKQQPHITEMFKNIEIFYAVNRTL